MRAMKRLLSPTLSSMLLILFLVFTVDADKRGWQRDAEEVKKVICPQCHKMEDGMIQEFYVVSKVGREDMFFHCDIHSYITPKTALYGDDMFYALMYVPVFNMTKFQRYMIEINGRGQFKRVQVMLMDGDYQYAVKGHNDMAIRKPQYCFHNKEYPMDHDRAFVYLNLYIKSKTEAYNLEKVCDDDFKTEDPAELLKDLPRELAGEFNHEYLDKCFEFKNRTCVYDVDNPSYVTFFEGKRNRIAYMRNGLVVYLGCIEYRCSYFIHDTKTGTDWWISDDLKVYTYKIQGDIRTIVPLLRPDDPFYTSELRYKYAPSTTTTTTTSTTTTTTTLKPITRPDDKPGGGHDAEHDDAAPEEHGDTEEEHEDGGEQVEASTETSSSSQYVVLMWIVALMLCIFLY
ncbi:unnamed protein product [Bursaphelenchus okinawaensis]|uniref:Uncharacterized protein n=1 Tax=Bursaphelenchus okinawaensis TaxID=465554 RepID=A0A811JVE9_9BILA|nr:unnamed protein product [Bursaphelenchus okinawaensis]CAG9084787.1 unnamed protein product [Bursaphelenchus okinawaensis]